MSKWVCRGVALFETTLFVDNTCGVMSGVWGTRFNTIYPWWMVAQLQK